ncbi:endolytic transglycosylase MltG [Flavobacteriaceae bacterium R38]|nr:endolytic transglycosylase MltG [Flavobacteriaceae bacterium R38]
MYLRKILIVIALIGIIGGGLFVYNIYQAIFSPNTDFKDDKAIVYISSEDTFQDVKNQLELLLKDMASFDLVAGRKGYTNNIKAGKYEIKAGMSNNDIINALRSRNIPVKLTFNNQNTLEELAGRISNQIEADSSSLITAFKSSEFLSKNEFTDDTALSMYIPNSYEFFWNTSAEKFRDRMLKEYNRFWEAKNRLAKAKEIGLTKAEVISLASIVHEESKKADERPRVAGLYLNRLKKNMLLQADPTVIYAIKRHTSNYDTLIKRVLYKDLEIDSPYNTYKHVGVPPGPIAMPDISAIDAVLNAENHEYLYFVADVSNFGYHKFAKTLAQHNSNKRQYIRWINKKGIKR